jgi:hypothetical protein
MKPIRWRNIVLTVLALALVTAGCASDRAKNQAKEAAARYWQDKAYPGKSFDIQVIEAEKADGGMYRVKGIVDGETRVGMFNPETETFSEGYYSLAHEREKRIAELEQEVKYWKDRTDTLEKESYRLKVQMSVMKQGGNPGLLPSDVPAPAYVPAPPPAMAPAAPGAAAPPPPAPPVATAPALPATSAKP